MKSVLIVKTVLNSGKFRFGWTDGGGNLKAAEDLNVVLQICTKKFGKYWMVINIEYEEGK